MKRHKRKQHKAKPYTKIFLQDWGTFKNQTLVAVGVGTKEMAAYMKRIGAKQSSIDVFNNDKQRLEELMKSSNGFFSTPDDASTGSILWLKSWDESWKDYEVLIHELFHAVYCILGKGRSMMEEQEAMAYQQEFLFGEIRRKLNKK